MHFRGKAGSIASSEPSPVRNAVSNRSKSTGKRKTGDTTKETIPSSEKRDARKSSKRRKVSVYDAVAGE